MGILRSATVSWKTSLVGILVFVQVVAIALIASFDADPNTVADWNTVVIAGTAMVGAILAKDGNKSSEDHA